MYAIITETELVTEVVIVSNGVYLPARYFEGVDALVDAWAYLDSVGVTDIQTETMHVSV